MSEHEVEGTSRTAWTERLRAELDVLTDGGSAELLTRWDSRLPAPYRDVIAPGDAARDLLELEEVDGAGASGAPEMRIRFSPVDDQDGLVCLSAYSGSADLELSRLLPVLESLGLWIADELHWTLREDERRWHVYDVRLRRADGNHLDLAEDADRIADAVLAQWTGRTEVDGLNRLVVHAGLDWSDVDLLRAMVRYRRQIDPRYTVAYGFDVLVANPSDRPRSRRAARGALRPGAPRRRARRRVAPVDHGGVRRRRAPRPRPHPAGLVGTVEATVRTNRWCAVGRVRSRSCSTARPCPTSPRRCRTVRSSCTAATVEGVHLRAGPVARGGIRYSDRPQDLRTEVLDLMRTQVLKNALIVPTGAKGGFVLHGPSQRSNEPRRRCGPRTRPSSGRCSTSPTTTRRRGDPGPGRSTATTRTWSSPRTRAPPRSPTSPTALVEAGVLARGRVRVRRLGRLRPPGPRRHRARRVGGGRPPLPELGIDVQTDPITVVGIGDMSGDVFGNGMLLLRGHPPARRVRPPRHLPRPRPRPGGLVRRAARLHDLAGSSWQDYDRTLLSEGGGVFSRS